MSAIDSAELERLRREKPHLFVCSRCHVGEAAVPTGLCPGCQNSARQGRNHKRHVRRLRPTFDRRDPCPYCGRVPPPGQTTFDHATPLSLGGTGEPWNLVACCRECNHRKGERPFWVFVAESLGRQPHPLARLRASGERQRHIRTLLGLTWEEWNRPRWERPAKRQQEVTP